ncbi:hypothetical protein Gpo141_00009965 [Globisporangium polare]
MKQRLPDDVMPMLHLTPDEQSWIERESDAMVESAVEAFDAFIANKRAFPKDKWKRIKSRGGFSVFRTHEKTPSRKHKPSSSAAAAPGPASSSVSSMSQRTSTTRSSMASTSSSILSAPMRLPSMPQKPQLPMGKKPKKQFPTVVLTGIVPGTMEDTAYGAVAADEDVWRLRATYANDLMHDCKILATLKRPTPEDPFRFLGVKWAHRKLPAFVQRRDMVYVESTGPYGSDPTKCEAGYTLMHSIELPGAPELTQFGVGRMNVSMCYLIRPYDETHVEFYCRAFCIPEGKIPTGLAARIYAEALLTAVNMMECSYIKKLMWLTQQRRKRSIEYTKQSLDVATHCQGCLRGLKLFGGLVRSASQCSCCRRIVCLKCSSARKVVLDISEESEVTQKSLPFCAQCVVEAKKLPALDIALATVDSWHDQ